MIWDANILMKLRDSYETRQISNLARYPRYLSQSPVYTRSESTINIYTKKPYPAIPPNVGSTPHPAQLFFISSRISLEKGSIQIWRTAESMTNIVVFFQLANSHVPPLKLAHPEQFKHLMQFWQLFDTHACNVIILYY